MENTDADDAKLAAKRQLQIFKWQQKLLPWMVIVPTVLIAVFVILATLQLRTFNNEVENYKTSELDKLFWHRDSAFIKIPGDVNKGEFTKLYVLAKMDEQLMNKRYSQGGVLLLSRLYTKYLGFFTGMILAIVGAVFIISKLSERESKLKAGFENVSLTLLSNSPGIIFGVLGTCLMMTTILKHNDIEIKDVSTYLQPEMPTSQPLINTTDQQDTSIDSMMINSSPYKP